MVRWPSSSTGFPLLMKGVKVFWAARESGHGLVWIFGTCCISIAFFDQSSNAGIPVKSSSDADRYVGFWFECSTVEISLLLLFSSSCCSLLILLLMSLELLFKLFSWGSSVVVLLFSWSWVVNSFKLEKLSFNPEPIGRRTFSFDLQETFPKSFDLFRSQMGGEETCPEIWLVGTTGERGAEVQWVVLIGGDESSLFKRGNGLILRSTQRRWNFLKVPIALN